VAYVPGIVLAGGVPVPVATEEEHEFRLRPEDVERAITPRTRAILLGFPNNPTGGVLTDDDVHGLARLAEEHDLLVYADESDDGCAERLLVEEKVVTVAGNEFRARGRGHVRACDASSLEKIEEACDRIARFVGRA